MKKFFSFIALAALLVACQPEEIQTAFTVGDAVATINVKAVDVQTQAEANNVTITASAGTVNGKVITLKGNPILESQVVTVNVKFGGNNKTYTGQVNVDKLLAGGVASYGLVVPVNDPKPDTPPTPSSPIYGHVYSLVPGFTADSTDVKYLPEGKDHGTSHVGNTGQEHSVWVQNNQEYMLNVNVTYTEISGGIITHNVTNPDFAPIVQAYVSAFSNDPYTETEKEMSFSVSAFCWYTAWRTIISSTHEFKVMAQKTEDGKLVGDAFEIGTVEVKAFATQVEYDEMPIPAGAEGHGHPYVHGHGHGTPHDHSINFNAGGGMGDAQ